MKNFRELTPNEIEIKTQRKNGKFVLMFYKDARCDQRILDETVGPLNWQKRYSRNNMNCVVSIWDEEKKQWVEKEDTGTESSENKEKGLASDSFKRACFVWGIGRSLYTIKDLDTYVTVEELGNAVKDSFIDGEFRLIDIHYEDGTVTGLMIGFYRNGQLIFKKRFTKESAQIKYYTEEQPEQPEQPQPLQNNEKAKAATEGSEFSDLIKVFGEEKLLFGNCKGMTIREAEKKQPQYLKSFLNWVKTSNTDYRNDPNKQAQYDKLKSLLK